MLFRLLVLFTLCVLATGVPKDKRQLGAEYESNESKEHIHTADTTTVKPESKIIAIKNATDLNTQIVQAGDKVVIIFFMTTWCPFCRKITPTIEKMATETENLVVLRVDRDNIEKGDDEWNYGLSNLPAVPMFIFLKNGKKVEEISGSDSDLYGTLAKVISTRENMSSRTRSKSLKDSSESSSKSSREDSSSSNSSEE